MDNKSLKLLTVDELASELRVPISWVYDKTRQTGPGVIPRIKVGKYLRFELNEVMGWLERQNAVS
jgi:excisionase family DNA binding protein